MNKIKRVKGKNGKIYEYDASKYVYKHKSTKGLSLVNKSGRVNKANVDKVKRSIDANDQYTSAEKIYLKADLDAYVAVKKKNKEKLTSSGFFGKEADDNITRMFTNAGYTTSDVANRLGVDESELLDEDNWVGERFTYNGKTFEFNFTYTGDIMTEVN